MIDILGEEKQCREIVNRWLNNANVLNQLINPDLSLSWGISSKFITTDPDQIVKITKAKIIINQIIPDYSNWKLDYIKGLVFQSIDPLEIKGEGNKIIDIIKWEYSKLVALFLIPPKLTNRSAKRHYLTNWENRLKLLNKDIKYNFHRFYFILNSINKNRILEMLGEFIFNVYNSENNFGILTQFHFYLYNQLPHPITYDDIDVITASIKNQVTTLRGLEENISHLSKTKIYNSKQRTQFQINSFFIPNRRILGLLKMYLLKLDDHMIDKLRSNAYFEGIEAMIVESTNFVKFRFPTNLVKALIQNKALISKDVFMFVSLPDLVELRISPEMFNPTSKKWYSIYNVKATTIEIKENIGQEVINPYNLTNDEVASLNHLLKIQDNNPANNHSKFSKSETKKLLKSLKINNSYNSIIISRKPSNLNTFTICIPLEMNKFESKIIKEFEKLNSQAAINDYLYNLIQSSASPFNVNMLNHLKSYSWPYMTVEYCITVNALSDKPFNFSAIIRISALENDVDRVLKENPTLSLIGTQIKNQGTLFTIPTQLYNEPNWDFSIDEFLDALS